MTYRTMAAALVLAAAGPVAAQQQQPGVCAQLAPQSGLKQQEAKRGQTGAPEWRVNMLGGLGATLFGGSTGATFKVEPVDGSTADQHLEDACRQVKSEIVCTLGGPSAIVVGTKAGEARAELASGQRAEVAMRGRYLTCRDL